MAKNKHTFRQFCQRQNTAIKAVKVALDYLRENVPSYCPRRSIIRLLKEGLKTLQAGIDYEISMGNPETHLRKVKREVEKRLRIIEVFDHWERTSEVIVPKRDRTERS